MAVAKLASFRIQGGTCSDIDVRRSTEDDSYEIAIVQGSDSVWLDADMATVLRDVLDEMLGSEVSA